MNRVLSERNRVQLKMGHTLRFGASNTQCRNQCRNLITPVKGTPHFNIIENGTIR